MTFGSMLEESVWNGERGVSLVFGRLVWKLGTGSAVITQTVGVDQHCVHISSVF